MKKKIKLIITIALLSIVGYLGYKIASKLNHKKEVAARIQHLPDFSFTTIQGAAFTQDHLQNKPTVFVYFNSDCDYCKSEAAKIQKRLSAFKNVQLIFISFEKSEAIQQFAKDYKLNDQENVLFLEDKKGLFSQLFDANTIPYLLVYDTNRKLLQKFKGATKVDWILGALK